MQQTQPFPSQRLCPACGFELTGYGRLAPCPSCGNKPAHRSGAAKTTRYEDTPLPYLRRTFLSTTTLAIGAGLCIVAYGAWLGVSALHHAPFFGRYYFPESALHHYNGGAHLIGMLGSLIYLFGVWEITSRRDSILRFTKPGTRPSAILRWVCRGTQSCWFFYHLAAYAWLIIYPADFVYGATAGVLFAIASLGLIPFALHLSGLASWAFGDEFSNGLAFSGIGVGCAGVLLGLVYTFGVPGGAIGAVIGLATVVVTLLIPMGVFLYLRAYFRLAGLTKWSIRCRHEADARDERLRARASTLTPEPL